MASLGQTSMPGAELQQSQPPQNLQQIQSMVMPMNYANNLPGADNNPAITPTPPPMGHPDAAPPQASGTAAGSAKPSKKSSKDKKGGKSSSTKKKKGFCC